MVPSSAEASQRTETTGLPLKVHRVTTSDQQAGLTLDQLREWLGAPRLGKYLAAAGGHPGKALALYRWNADVAAAALLEVGHFEVALRNAYDQHLSAVYPNWAADLSSALFARAIGSQAARAPQLTLNSGSLDKLAEAHRRINGPVTHGQAMAALDFGFWATLTRRERTATFWTPMLSRAFPTAITRGEVHDRADNLRKFRNRLAHNEPVFSTRTGLAARMQDLRTTFAWIRPEVAIWVQTRSRVPALAAACPIPGLLPTIP